MSYTSLFFFQSFLFLSFFRPLSRILSRLSFPTIVSLSNSHIASRISVAYESFSSLGISYSFSFSLSLHLSHSLRCTSHPCLTSLSLSLLESVPLFSSFLPSYLSFSRSRPILAILPLLVSDTVCSKDTVRQQCRLSFSLPA